MAIAILNRRVLLRSSLATGLFAAWPLTAGAHRQKKVQSTIEWNARTSSLEVTHVLHRHDAEKALALSGKLKKPDLTSLKARAVLALHLNEQFGIRDVANTQIELEIIGAENTGSLIYTYFEARLDTRPEGLIISNTILHDIYADQINHVNIEIGTTIKSAIFVRGDKAKKVLA